MSAERRYSDREIYRRVLVEARPYWGHIAAIFVLTLLATPLALLGPLPLKIAVDSVLDDKPLPGFVAAIAPASLEGSTGGLLVFAVLLLVSVELMAQVQSLSTKLLRTYTSERLTLRFRAKLFRHAQRLSMSYHDRKGSADANYRIQSDAASLPNVAVSGVIPFVSSGLTFTTMLVIVAGIEPSLALIALVVAPLMAGLTWGYRRRLRARHREVKALESSALGVVQEVLTSLRVVKAFAQEDREAQRFTNKAAAGTRARLRVAVVDGSFWLAIGLVTAAGTALVLYVGVRSVESGAMTLGSLLLVMSYLGRLYSPLYTISSQVASLQAGFASGERVFTLFDEAADVSERPDARPIGRAQGAVEFRDVSFGYASEQPVLERVSFRAEPSARVGIAGRTGSGKTTLVSLLTRFYDPSAGAILLDGVDLRDYRVEDLRKQFAIVLQDPVLFSTTIRENIAYGKTDATFEEIVAAAEAADVHDFISTLPEGYDTPVGERGMTLSGGERQRISLARAFLKDAPILILDEPTSSVDVKTESAILAALERLMNGRTTFIIAHRLSTLEGCHLRLEIRDGGVTVDRSVGREPQRDLEPHARARHSAYESLPVVQAWERLRDRKSRFTRVDLLEETRSSLVFRLREPGRDGLDVVAKQRRLGKLEPERVVYEDILPSLSIRHVRYLGTLGADRGDLGWLFVEHVAGEPLDHSNPHHLACLADHLASVHGGASSLPALARLPDRGSAFFRNRLEYAVAQLRAGLANTTIGTFDREVLLAHLAILDPLVDDWGPLALSFDALPRTLAHCDVKSSNTRIAEDRPGPRLAVFDWEHCGAGGAAPDLPALASRPAALRRYADASREHWPHLSFGDVAHMADVGTVLRYVLAISWDGASLDQVRPERSLRRLARYWTPLVVAVERARATTHG